MSEDVITTAIRSAPRSAVIEKLTLLLEHAGLTVEDRGEIPFSGWRDSEVFVASQEGWTLVHWPESLGAKHFGWAQELSSGLEATVSAITVPDGSSWNHGLFVRGELVDQFGSYPDLWVSSRSKKRELREAWKGNAEICAKHLEVSVEQVAPYYVYWPEDGDECAFPEDRFELSESWVFTDFWQKVGIVYPDDLSSTTVHCLSAPGLRA